MTSLDYFFFFLKYKINSGVKQIDLARSEHVPISKQYLNKLINKRPKKCSFEIQSGIAKYFDLTYDEMIAEAERLYKQDQERRIELEERRDPTKLSQQKGKNLERRSRSPLNLIKVTTFLQSGIQENHNYTLELEKEKDSLIRFFNILKTGICIVDEKLKVLHQNPYHRQMFGSLAGKTYSFFWNNSLSKKEIFEELTTTTSNNYLEKEYKGAKYKIQFSLSYSDNIVENIVEQVVLLKDDTEYPLIENLNHMDIYPQIFKHLDYGFGFFNNKRELEIASDKFGVLDQYNFPDIKPSVDQLLLDLNEKIESSSLHQIPKMKKAYENRQEINLEVNIDGINYNFQTKNISMNDEHIGILLIVRKIL